MARPPLLRRVVPTRHGYAQTGGVRRRKSPMADGKDRKPVAEDTPRNGNDAKSKSPDEGGARAAKTGNAPGAKDAAKRLARETSERKAKWQAEDDRLARDAEERRARGQLAYEQAEKDAAQRLAREATERKARWQAEDERLGREAEERRAWRVEYERAEREAQ